MAKGRLTSYFVAAKDARSALPGPGRPVNMVKTMVKGASGDDRSGCAGAGLLTVVRAGLVIGRVGGAH